jgi:hypothetical protein
MQTICFDRIYRFVAQVSTQRSLGRGVDLMKDESATLALAVNIFPAVKLMTQFIHQITTTCTYNMR